MNVQVFLKGATKILEQNDIATARLDCLVLLEDVLGVDRAVILAHPDLAIPQAKLSVLNKKITQRRRHIPLAYIRGKVSFYGREFAVNKHILVPRPESETMIDWLIKLPLPASPKVADIGTGTGCLGITAALELHWAEIGLYDIDPFALKLARQNAKALNVKAAYYKADLLELKPAADVLLANLPYVPDRYKLNQAAEHEPKHAIFGGKDGLDLYRRLWQQIAGLPGKPLFVMTESLPPQHQALNGLAQAAGYRPYQTDDFIQIFQPA
jgi:release factor glutamine methyltransferase